MNLPGKYNQVEAQYIENKIDKEILIQSLKYLPSFLQDKDFKPLDDQEEAKQAFINRVKKENILQLDKPQEIVSDKVINK